MKHWIFDFDGTLVDSDAHTQSCINYALEPFGQVVAPDFIEQVRHRHPGQIFDDLLNVEERALAFKRLAEISQDKASEIKAFGGIEVVLEHLNSRGISLSIWTGRDRHSTEMILKKQGLLHFFSKIVSGTCVPNNKPSTDGLVVLLGHYQSPVTDMVMVGDHHHDIEPANDLGMYSIHARWKKIPHELPTNLSARVSLDHPLEILTLLPTK